MKYFPLFQSEFLGNKVQDYILSLLAGLLAVLVLRITAKILFTHLNKLAAGTRSHHDDFLAALGQKILFPLLYVGAVYFALTPLKLNAGFAKWVHVAALAVLTVQLTQFALAVSIYIIERTWLKKQTDQGGTPVSASILTIFRLVVWGLALVFLFDNLGFNVSAIVAGLGIGGVAVALAAQTILGDLFNYFVIFFDRPFEEGDFIVLDHYMGEIENIGIKSTRIRSVDGEQIVISNSNLTGSRIRNFKRMSKRRVLFKLGLVYETPNEKLEKIPGMIRAIIEGQPKTRFDRAHFKEFADFSLVFEVVYFIQSPDYNYSMDVQEKINLAIKAAFEKEKIEFAYPTQLAIQKPFPL